MKLRTINEASNIIEDLIYDHLGSDWRFSVNHRFKRLYGRCDFLTRTIQIASVCATHCTDDHLQQMVLHEIAHGLSQNVGHNKVFKAICGMLECANDTPYFEDYASLDYLEK